MTGEEITARPLCGAQRRAREGGRCMRPAGWGTSHLGVDRCKLHGGSTRNHCIAAAKERLAQMATCVDSPYSPEGGRAAPGAGDQEKVLRAPSHDGEGRVRSSARLHLVTSSMYAVEASSPSSMASNSSREPDVRPAVAVPESVLCSGASRPKDCRTTRDWLWSRPTVSWKPLFERTATSMNPVDREIRGRA